MLRTGGLLAPRLTGNIWSRGGRRFLMRCSFPAFSCTGLIRGAVLSRSFMLLHSAGLIRSFVLLHSAGLIRRSMFLHRSMLLRGSWAVRLTRINIGVRFSRVRFCRSGFIL